METSGGHYTTILAAKVVYGIRERTPIRKRKRALMTARLKTHRRIRNWGVILYILNLGKNASLLPHKKSSLEQLPCF